ncbi:ankyrin repeat domain-containing protein 6 [Enoplosus armatus]|uniref:ankyrin repeat domain-containing protein 6 n=1 Tax=Enoplosus armatus TaxID=215367 RepID=UPI0039936DBD
MSEKELAHVPPSPRQGQGHQPALHRAAMVGNSDAVAALIQGGCAVDLQDRDGNTALHEVSWHGFSHCVKLLVKAGAAVHIRNKAGNTALHLACQNAHAQTARLLLLGGSAPDAKNNMGDTCLHVAARYNNLTLVKVLLTSLCPVAERNQGGDTALHVAAALNHKRTVQLLLEAEADGKIRNNAGKTALDKARDNNHKEVALLLARAPQIHRFMRGRTIRKQRGRLRAERRAQSVPKVEILPNKDSSSVVEETPSSEQIESRTAVKVGPHPQQQHYHETPATVSSPYSHHKRRRVKQQALNEDEGLRKGRGDSHNKKCPLCDNGEDTQNGKTYQLFTLYRDMDGNVRQAPANGCRCKPLLKKLEGQLKATEEGMRLHILKVHEQVNSRLSQMDRRSRHRQAAASQELKRWCVSQLRDIPAKAQYYKLLHSPSVEQSVADADLESLPLLSVESGDSSTSLATYVNILPSKSAHGQEQMGNGACLNMRVDRSPDDYENTALFPLPANHTLGLLLGSVDPLEGFSSSTSQSNISEHRPRLIQYQEHSYNRQWRRHCGELTSAQGRAEGTRTLEFFIDRPTEPTFSQERNNLHAMEVTQRFFETVSTQLERWYERKIAEVEQQTELRAQQDRGELLQRISALEEELQRLKTNENAES